MGARLLDRGERRIERLHRGLNQCRRLRMAAFQSADRSPEGGDGRIRACHRFMRFGEILGDLLGRHHAGAPVGQRGLFAGDRRELGEFIDRMAQIFGFALRALDLDAMRVERFARLAARVPEQRDRFGLLFQAAKRVEQPAMRRGIDQRTVVMLTVDFDEHGAEAFERLHADRLIVDEGARLAVGKLHAAQDQRVFRLNAVVLQQRPGRVLARQFEHGGDLALLLALADQRGVAARAQSQRKGVEQDGLAGAGLAGQHAKTLGEIEIELVDQDDVPN